MKRLLSLALALVMLVLAVPVFALPLAAETEIAPLTANFYLPTADKPTEKGAAIKTGTFATLAEALPTDADLAATGYTADDILTWAYYASGVYYYDRNGATDANKGSSYLDIKDYFNGSATFPSGTVDFYPVFKSSAHTQNLPILSGAMGDSSRSLVTYRGGWSYYSPYNKQLYPFAASGSTMQVSGWSAWLYGGMYFNGNLIVGSSNTYSTILRYQVMQDGTATVTIPRVTELLYSGEALDNYLRYAVIKNGLNGEQLLGADAGTAGNLYDNTTAWFTFGENETEKVITVKVKKGDTIDVAVHLGKTSSKGAVADFNPMIELEPLETVTYPDLFHFYAGPTTSNGQNTIGTFVAKTNLFHQELPTDAELASLNLTVADVIDWCTWNAEEDAFVSVQEYFSGVRTATEPVYFYPLTKDTTSVPFYKAWIDGENQVLWTPEGGEVEGSSGSVLAYTGGWSYGSYIGDRYRTFDTLYRTSVWLLWSSETPKHAGGAVFAGPGGSYWSTPEAATTLTYQAPVSGKILVKIPHAYGSGVMTAVAKNGTFTWPAAIAGTPATAPDADTIGSWYAVPKNTGLVVNRNTRYAANNCQIFEMYVDAGDKIQFLIGKASVSANEYWYPGIEYTDIYDTPTASAGIVVDSALSVNTAVTTPDGLEGVVESGMLVDGVKLEGTTIPVAAKDAGKVIVVQPYYVMESGVTVYGKKSVITVREMLEDYATSEDETVKAAAEATLDYTAAADAYFDESAAAPEVVAPAGKDAYVEKSESIGVSEYVGENKVEFRGISLLLNDRINIKIVIKGELPQGATLQISKTNDFAALETIISGDLTEDGKSTKFIMDGISAVNWNTDYYIRVVDAEKNAISDTLCYSVAAYYGRMIDRAEASDKLKAVISSLMSLYEAVSAN